MTGRGSEDGILLCRHSAGSGRCCPPDPIYSSFLFFSLLLHLFTLHWIALSASQYFKMRQLSSRFASMACSPSFPPSTPIHHTSDLPTTSIYSSSLFLTSLSPLIGLSTVNSHLDWPRVISLPTTSPPPSTYKPPTKPHHSSLQFPFYILCSFGAFKCTGSSPIHHLGQGLAQVLIFAIILTPPPSYAPLPYAEAYWPSQRRLLRLLGVFKFLLWALLLPTRPFALSGFKIRLSSLSTLPSSFLGLSSSLLEHLVQV